MQTCESTDSIGLKITREILINSALQGQIKLAVMDSEMVGLRPSGDVVFLRETQPNVFEHAKACLMSDKARSAAEWLTGGPTPVNVSSWCKVYGNSVNQPQTMNYTGTFEADKSLQEELELAYQTIESLQEDITQIITGAEPLSTIVGRGKVIRAKATLLATGLITRIVDEETNKVLGWKLTRKGVDARIAVKCTSSTTKRPNLLFLPKVKDYLR